MTLRAPAFTTRPEIDGTFGVVATTHWLGTAVAMAMLERGGNAFDAGVAAAFTLQVAEPHLVGPGGDVPVMLYDTRRGRPEVVCGQGPSPAAATIDHFRSLGLDLVPGTGLLAPCVPGAFGTWMLILRERGTMRLRDVLVPAIHYARRGIPVLPGIAAAMTGVADLFRSHWPTSAAVFLPHGDVPKVGDLFANPALAATYERIVADSEAGGGSREAEIERAETIWSDGFVAEAIDRFCRSQELMDVSGRRHRGLLTGDDLARWRPTVEDPARIAYGRYTVLKPGFWSQGPATLQQLALLAGFDLDGLDPTGPDFIHLQVECAKLAFADREAFYADPDKAAVPADILLSATYSEARRKLVDDTASLELRPGVIPGFGGPVLEGSADGARTAGSFGTGEPTIGTAGATRGDTVHIDVIDADGNMFTATPSGGWLQSSPVIPELGFPLGTRMQMFWLDERSPNALAPVKRPRTTLSPSMALRDGEPWLIWGTPGGDQQDQWIPQMFLRHVHAGMNLQAAIDAPAWHTEHMPSSFWPRVARPGVVVVEGRVPAATVAELRRRGHVVEVGGDWSEGRLTAASREGGRLRAAANPRGMQGYAIGR